MVTLFGIVLGWPIVFAAGVVLGWHIPMPPWAKAIFAKLGWKTAA
jgi:hypothetical protein